LTNGKASCFDFNWLSMRMMNEKNAIHFLKIVLLSLERCESLWITFSFWYFLMHVNLCDWEVVEPFDSFDYCVPNLLLRYSFLLSTVGMHVSSRCANALIQTSILKSGCIFEEKNTMSIRSHPRERRRVF